MVISDESPGILLRNQSSSEKRRNMGLDQKTMRKIRDKDDSEKYVGLLRLAQALSFLVVFVAGVVIGLTMTSHINNQFSAKSELFTLMNHVSIGVAAGGGGVREEENCNIICEENNDCFNMETFLHPTNVSHDLLDDELLWRASLVPMKEEYPYRRIPKLAFMFLTRGPLPLLPLWERFFQGHEELFNIYVHAPPGYTLNVSNLSVFYGRQIPSQVVSWGSVSLADAERRLLGNALLDFSNERFILLSESCIPIYNFSTVYKYLTDSINSFVESYDDPSRYGRGRYSRNMLPHIHLKHWRKGSQWFELRREVAIHLVSDTKYYTLFRKYCKPACYPDEHYIPTFLNMFYGDMNSNRTVTWVNWSMGGPHPATYRRENITVGFLQALRDNGTLCRYNSEMTSVCFLFARKFDSSTLEPLLSLASTVLNF